MFKEWLKRAIGVPVLPLSRFPTAKGNCILEGSDAELMSFARESLGYDGEKGLDFVGRFGGQYVVGEAKFLTDFGGHQNAQFEDAKRILENRTIKAVKIAILDGVLYIPGAKGGGNKMYRYLVENKSNHNILSALVLNEFLFAL